MGQSEVRLVQVASETQHILENFFTPYFFELSRYDKNLPMNTHGLPAWEAFGGIGPATHSECVRYNWWIRDETQNYLLYQDDLPVGFALILREKAHLPEGIATELVDFYIAPRYRGKHLGLQAAQSIVSLYKGRWVLFTLTENLPARCFWRRVLTDTPAVTDWEVNQNETEWFFTSTHQR
jgi:predicted acetyltransferase